MSKNYQVIIEPEALAGIESAYEWIQGYSSERASIWLNGLLEAIQSLSTMPLRCPLAIENDYFEEEIRQLLYGKRGRADNCHLITTQPYPLLPFLSRFIDFN